MKFPLHEVTWESKVRWCKGRKGKYWSPADKESMLLTKNQCTMNSLWIHYEYHQPSNAWGKSWEVWHLSLSMPAMRTFSTAGHSKLHCKHLDVWHLQTSNSGHCKTETAKCHRSEHFLGMFLAIKDRSESGSPKTLTRFKGGRDFREERQANASCNQLAETISSKKEPAKPLK